MLLRYIISTQLHELVDWTSGGKSLAVFTSMCPIYYRILPLTVCIAMDIWNTRGTVAYYLKLNFYSHATQCGEVGGGGGGGGGGGDDYVLMMTSFQWQKNVLLICHTVTRII